MVRIWDARTGELLERLRGHRDSVYSVAFTPDARGLVSGSLDKTLKYWDVSRLANGPGGRSNSPGVSKRDPLTGKKDIGTREGNSACTMNFTGHKVRVEFGDSGCVNCLVQDYVLSVAVSHDGQWVVSGSKDRGVQFWDAKTAIVQLMLQGHKNSGPLSPTRSDAAFLRLTDVPFQSSQLISVPPEVFWRLVRAIGRLVSVSHIVLRNWHVVERLSVLGNYTTAS